MGARGDLAILVAMLRRALLRGPAARAPDLGAASPATWLAPASLATATRDYAKSARGRVREAPRCARRRALPSDDVWEEVRDETTGQTYWWNVRTNETTALGAEKPRLLGTSVGNGNAPPPVGQPQRSDALARPGGGSMLGGSGAWSRRAWRSARGARWRTGPSGPVRGWGLRVRRWRRAGAGIGAVAGGARLGRLRRRLGSEMDQASTAATGARSSTGSTSTSRDHAIVYTVRFR